MSTLKYALICFCMCIPTVTRSNIDTHKSETTLSAMNVHKSATTGSAMNVSVTTGGAVNIHKSFLVFHKDFVFAINARTVLVKMYGYDVTDFLLY